MRCWPALVQVEVSDPPPVVAGVSVGDTITLRFENATNRPELPTQADIDSFVELSAELGRLSAAWVGESELVLVVEDPTPDLDPVASSVDELVVRVRNGTQLRDESGLSQVRCAVTHVCGCAMRCSTCCSFGWLQVCVVRH